MYCYECRIRKFLCTYTRERKLKREQKVLVGEVPDSH